MLVFAMFLVCMFERYSVMSIMVGIRLILYSGVIRVRFSVIVCHFLVVYVDDFYEAWRYGQ